MDRAVGLVGQIVQTGVEIISRSLLGRTLALILLALALHAPGLATLPVTDRDEGRFVQATKQMMESGDYIDIRFQDEPRWKKPVGIYWLQAGAAQTVGDGAASPIWVYRLPSLIAIALAGALTAWAATVMVGRREALVAGAIAASSVLAAVEGNIGKTDAVLLAAVVAAMGALARLLLTAAPTRGMAALFWGACGFAILIKGPMIFLPVLGALIFHCAGARSLAPLGRLRALWGVPLMSAIALPWLIAIGIETDWAFFRDALGGDLLAKIGEGAEKHWGPPGFYVGVVWGTFWPWAPLLLLAAPAIWAARKVPEGLFLLGWAVPTWIVFEIVATKLPHYVLPVYPALAILLAQWMLAAPVTSSRRLGKIAAAFYAVPAAALILGNVFGPPLIEGTFPVAGAALALAALPFALIAARALLEARRAAYFGAALASAGLLFSATLHYGLPSLKTGFASPRMVAAMAADPCIVGPIRSLSYREPSLVFLGGTDTEFPDDANAAAILAARAGAGVWVEDDRRAAFDALIAAAGTPLAERARLSAFNYNRGDPTELRLLVAADDPAFAACPPPG